MTEADAVDDVHLIQLRDSNTLPLGQQETYAYDAVGNRTYETVNGQYSLSDPANVRDPSGRFGLSGAIHALSVTSSLATAATAGYGFGSIIERSVRTGDVLSSQNAKSAAGVALSILPMNHLVKISNLSGVAAKLEPLGFASVIYDKSPSVKGFNKVFHWVQRLQERGFALEDVLKAVTQGSVWIDSKSGAIVRVVGDARANGTMKVLFVDGKITTVLSDKLGKKFIPY